MTRSARAALLAALVAALLALVAGARGDDRPAAASGACVTVPSALPQHRYISNGGPSSVTVTAGSVVYVALVEADKYLTPGDPSSFPWAAPRSADPKLLAPLKTCPSNTLSSLPEGVYAFRALKPGRVTVTAGLTAAWRSVAQNPGPFRGSVSVRR